MREETAMQRDKLMNEVRAVMSDAEELLSLAKVDATDGARVLKERLRQNLSQARSSLADLQATAGEKAKVAGRAADDYVQRNPWRAVGFAAGVGLVLGLLVGRR